jgi:hypothetical protein
MIIVLNFADLLKNYTRFVILKPEKDSNNAFKPIFTITMENHRSLGQAERKLIK